MSSETFDIGCEEDASPDMNHVTLVFPGDRNVQVRERRFMELSDVYASDPVSPGKFVSHLNLSDDTIQSLKAWLEGEGGCEVNKDNFDELLLFANEWEMQGFVVSVSSLLMSPSLRTRNVAFWQSGFLPCFSIDSS